MWTLRHKDLTDHFVQVYVVGYIDSSKWSTETAALNAREKHCKLPWIISYEHN